MKKLFLLLGMLPAIAFAQNGITAIPVPSSFTNASKTTLALDNANNKWIGTIANGIAMYNGSAWTTFDMSAGLPSNHITSFAFSGGTTWVGTYNGAAFYNGTNWGSYQVANSGLCGDTVLSVATFNNDVWFGTTRGLSKFDGTNWTTYNTINSGLSSDYIYSIAIDAAGALWIGTKLGGLVYFDGTLWTVINTPFPSNNVTQVYIDNSGEIWLGGGSSQIVTQQVLKFTGTGFANLIMLHPEIATMVWGPVIGPVVTGPHGGAFFQLLGYTEDDSQFSHYNLDKAVTSSVYESSTSRMWFISRFTFQPALYVFDPAQHSALGLITPDNTKYLDVNKVNTAMMNRGDMHWNTFLAQYEVPKGGGAHAVFASALWLGGLDAGGNLHQAAMTYRQTGADYFPGPLDTVNGTTDSVTAGNYDHIWKIDKTEILAFQYYWGTGDVQNGNYVPAEDFLTWPAHGTGNHMRNLAPYVDVNNNGIYDPLTGGDYPQIKGDQMLYWIFNDNLTAHTETGGLPLKVEVHASAYAFNCPVIAGSDSVLNYTTYYNFQVYNWSTQQYHDTYIGLWQDADLGFFSDDYVGCYPSSNISFTYNGDQDDGGSPTPTLGTYGAHPPINSIVMLDGPAAEPGDGIDNDNDGTVDESGEHNMLGGFHYFENDFSVTGNPEHADDYYNYMTGKWKDSTLVTYGGNGYGGVTPTRFMYDELPYHTTGWNETTAGNTPNDRRYVASCGPFNLNPATPVSIDYAIMFTRDMTAGAYDSLQFSHVLDGAARLRQWYAAQNTPSCAEWNVGIAPVEQPASLLTVYPNPASTLLTIAYQPASEKATFELLDVTGRVVQSGSISSSGQTTIAVAELPVGIYAIRVVDNGSSIAVKFIRE